MKYSYKYKHLEITIDPANDSLLTEFAKTRLRDGYTVGSETIQEAFARASCAFADNAAHAQRLYDYCAKYQWFMFATPLLSNGGTQRGLPISCFLNFVPDSRDGIASHYAENIWLSTSGGGIGSDWSTVRSVGTRTSKGNETTGVLPFMHVSDSLSLAANQGSTRRGSNAMYLDISHPEVEEFIRCRRATGGNEHRMNRNSHIALNILDSFMEAVVADDNWELIDPHTKEVKKVLKARQLWVEVLRERKEQGEPYLHFIDESNRKLSPELKAKGLKVRHSNLCTEILLPTEEGRTAVCCLSSVNLEKFDEWQQDELFIIDLYRMLDNALTVFIEDAPAPMVAAVYSATMERSVGLGAMGFHSYLQQKGIPFDSPMAVGQNKKMFKHIWDLSQDANRLLADERGSPPDLQGSRKRFAHMLAIAPNATSSIFLETSPGIEMMPTNYYVQKTLSGSFSVKNKILDKVLRIKYNLDEDALFKAWQEIAINEGSVQELVFLDSVDKAVFKTAPEVDQLWVIQHAADRQPYIDQGQSVNIYVPAQTTIKYLNDIHFMAWRKKLKTLYYCRSSALTRASRIVEVDESSCPACEG